MIKIFFFAIISIGFITQLLTQNAEIKFRSNKAAINEDENIDFMIRVSKKLSPREERSLNKKKRSKRMQNEIQYTMNNLAKIDKYFLDNVHHLEMISDCNQKLIQLKSDFELIGLKEIEELKKLETTSTKELSDFQQTTQTLSFLNDDIKFFNKEDDLQTQKDNNWSSRINSSSNTSSQILDNVKKQLIDYLK
jgi:hypothetical protein